MKEETLLHTRRTLATEERDTTLYPLVVCVSVLSWLIYRFLSPLVSNGVTKRGYTRLSEGIRVEWDARVVSQAHAVVVSLMSAYSHLFDEDIHIYLIWWDSPLVKASCAIVIGYLLFDAILMTVYFKYMGELGFYFHHAASIYAYYYAVSYDVMPFLANFRLLAEISTPFVNIRWFMMHMGVKKSSPAFLLNGLTLVITFFFCRVLAIPFFWHKVLLASSMDGFYDLGHIPPSLLATCLTLDFLNLYWFYKLLRGVLKMVPVLLGSGSSGTESSSSSSSDIGVQESGERDIVKRVKSG